MFYRLLHIYFTQFMNDRIAKERDLALFMDIVLLSKCSELWVFGDTISKGMAIEIEKAKRNRFPYEQGCEYPYNLQLLPTDFLVPVEKYRPLN